MAEFTIEMAKEHGEVIKAAFSDGFQLKDVLTVVKESMKVVEAFKGMTGDEKKAAALMIIDYVIDNTDIPWIPDSLVDPILKKFAPWVIELVVSASKGEVVNT